MVPQQGYTNFSGIYVIFVTLMNTSGAVSLAGFVNCATVDAQ
jgi:hypothetical protein